VTEEDDQYRYYAWMLAVCVPLGLWQATRAARPTGALLLVIVSLLLAISAAMLFRRSRFARPVTLGTGAAMLVTVIATPSLRDEPFTIWRGIAALWCCYALYEVATMSITVAEAQAALQSARREAARVIHARDQLGASLRDATAGLEFASRKLHAVDRHEGTWESCGATSCAEDHRLVVEWRTKLAAMDGDGT
jgi:hypothetical protein